MSEPARPRGLRAAAAVALLASLALGCVPGVLVNEPEAIEKPGAAAAGTHVPLTVRKGRLWTGVDAAQEISDVSAYCFSCHGGPGPSADASKATHGEGSPASSHPVDVAYPAKAAGYRARRELEPELLLLRGRVTCVTCHSPRDPEHAPVLATEGSRLCRACHLT